jgi:hypothetical protein
MTGIDSERFPGLSDPDEYEALKADVREGVRPMEMIEKRLRERLGEPALLDREVAANFHGRRPLAAEGRGGAPD